MKKTIKRITAVAAAAALAISFTFPAELGLADLGVGGNTIAASADTSGDFEYSVDGGDVKITKYNGSGGEVEIPATIENKPVTSIGDCAFQNCTGLKSITIPSSVTSIGAGAFQSCTGLTSVTIQNGVTSIALGAFTSCTGLTSITIPSSVTFIGKNVFQNCTGLTNITVDSSNPSFCSESGVLFNKDKTTLTLICYPLGKTDSSYTIPDGVTAIGDYAFRECSGLTSITIPSSVTSIKEGAFFGCSGLTSITIPSSVTSIEHNAFFNSSLTIIYIPSGVKFVTDEYGLGDFFPSTATKITYTVDSSNNVTITDISLSSGNKVDIPPTIDGKTVVAVGTKFQKYVGNHTCVSSTAATCINKATCGICGQQYGNHDLSHHDAVLPTCTTNGNAEYWECSLCQKNFSDSKGTAEITNIVESATGHSWSNDWSSDETGHWHDCTNANCPITENNLKNGYAVHTPGADATETAPQTCDVCGYELAPALGHIHANHLTLVAEIPAACTADGVKAHYECDCGKNFSDPNGTNEITDIVEPALGHSLNKTDEKAPTCTDDGNKAYWTCTECKNIFSDDAGVNQTTLAEVTVSAAGHSWSNDWSYDKTGHWHSCTNANCPITENNLKNGYAVHTPGADATETAPQTCDVCGYELAPALGHIHANHLTLVAEIPAACTADGVKAHYECDCGKNFSDPNGTNEITDIVEPALGHSLNKTDEKAPTCTDDGNKAYWTCTECKNIFSDDAGVNQTTLAEVTVSAAGHSWSNDWSYDETGHWHSCTNANCPITENNQKNGYAVHTPGADTTETTPQTCDICGYVITPESGHIHKNHLTFIAEAPETCTADGVKAHYECDCGKLFSDADGTTEVTAEDLKIAAHHTYGTDWESDNDNDHYHVCSVCNDKTDVMAHSYDNGAITTPATETTEGVKTYTCSVCHHTKTEAVPRLSHTHSLSTDYSKDETGHWHACSGCTEKVDFGAHTEDSGTVAVQPTETTEGIRAYSCSVCGYVLRTETIPALTPEHSHSYGTAWKYDITSHWHECECGEKTDTAQHISDGGLITVQPTETTAGVRAYSCSVCGYILRKETIPATGYNYYPTYPSYPTYPTYPAYPVFLTPSVFTENLTVNAEADGSTATLSWDEVQKAENYYVYQYKDGKYVKIKTTTDTSVTLEGLKNGETYKFLVRYSIGGRLSPMTYSYKITVKAYYKPIAKAASTENSVKLTWQAVPEAEKYAVYKYVDGKAVKLCETEKLAVRINKLAPDTEYQYIVRAYVDGKWTAMTKSDIVTVKTEAE